MVGERLGHYRILERIGAGGMGEVYLAEDLKLERRVALKVLPATMASDQASLARFEREAKTIASLNHPHVVTIHSVEQAGPVRFLTMELIEGAGLDRTIPPHGMDLPELIRTGAAVARALIAAHAKGIIHRDLKPANVMTTEDGRIKVLDFGLAKLVGASSLDESTTKALDLTRDGSIVGTLPYMSPEQVRGLAVDHRTDVFSFGALLYEMGTGRRPFQGATASDLASAILRDTPTPPSELVASLPRGFDAVVERCLQKNPAERYQSATEALEALLNLEEGRASRTGLPKRRWAVVAGAIVLCVAAAAALWSFVPDRDGESGRGTRGTVGVIGFENIADPEDPGHIGRMLMALVTTDLVESGGLDIASTAKITASLEQAGAQRNNLDIALARHAARIAKVDVMVVGQVMEMGSRLVLTAELVDVRSGNTIGSLKHDAANRDELFALAGEVADAVRRDLGARSGPETAEGFDLASTLTGSPEAYREYAAGELALHHQEFVEAAAHFAAAIRRDDSFAMAYFQLSKAQSWNGNQSAGLATLQKGLPHIGRLPERWRTVYRATIDWQDSAFDSAYDQLEPLVEAGVQIPAAYDVFGEVLTHSPRHWDPTRARAAFGQALAIDPSYQVVLHHWAEHSLFMGEDDAVEAMVQTLRTQGPATPVVTDLEMSLLTARREWRELARRASEKAEAGHWGGWYRYAVALTHLGQAARAESLAKAEGERQEGYQRAYTAHMAGLADLSAGRFLDGLTQEEEAIRLGPKPTWDPAMYHSIRAQTLLLIGRPGESRDAARAALASSTYYARARYWLVRALLELDDPSGADAAAGESAAALAETRSPEARVWHHFLSAEIALARGRTEKAREEMVAAGKLPAAYRDRQIEEEVQARLSLALGDTAAAIGAYRRVIEPPYPRLGREFEHGEWRIIETAVLYPLARLEEGQGEIASAEAHYRQYLAQWGKSDVPLPEVADAARRLGDLASAMGRLSPAD